MDIGIVSSRYAKALFEYAKNMGKEDVLYQEMTMLSKSLSLFPNLKEVLDNPILSIRDKYSLLCTAAVGNGSVSREYSRFITLVLRNHREEILHFMCLSFIEMYRAYAHIGVAKLITAVPVDRNTTERIRRATGVVLHLRLEMETVVDPAIEGGFILDYNWMRLDASVLSQLKRVRQQFIDKNRRIV